MLGEAARVRWRGGLPGNQAFTSLRWVGGVQSGHLTSLTLRLDDQLDCYDLLGETDVKTEGNLSARFERAASCTPCVLVLKHIEALARKSQTLETGQEPTITAVLEDCFNTARSAWVSSGYPLVCVATVTDPDKVPASLLGLFKEELSIEVSSYPLSRLSTG